MSTPTPIEIVREFQRWRRGQGKYGSYQEPMATIPWGPKVIGEALDAVLRDAERFKALEQLTWGYDHMIGMSRRKDDHMLVWGEGKTLADLADKLRSETK